MAFIGIDVEPNRPNPPGVLEYVACERELSSLETLRHADDTVSWDRLLFSAKESYYKSWYPVTRRWIGFLDAVVDLGTDGSFRVSLRSGSDIDCPPELQNAKGKWTRFGGYLLTSVWHCWSDGAPYLSSLGEAP
ncbi:MAG: 4'-phosphopantetheinyl transferase superfamily protein [Bifidobacteriaceae bacterium]|nr:4'-phosphopantetheinyl transferase superfamily protein [Bifidobacteriaceae bacterium]